MNLYATYAYYISTYRGNLTEEEFEKAIVPATAHVRRITMSGGLPSGGLIRIWSWTK